MADEFAWHSQACKELEMGISVKYAEIPQRPQCGFYQKKKVRGGVFVPARIYMSDGVMLCEVAGVEEDPLLEWTYLAARPIRENRYNYMMDVREWEIQNNPSSPIANPEKPVDWRTIPPPVFTPGASE